MAGRKENLKALFSNTRSRVIIVFTALVLSIAVIIGLLKFTSIFNTKTTITSKLARPGYIQSVPGALNPTEQYVTLQEEQNINQATQAQKSGGSAIPTIIRTQEFGKGIESVGPQHGQGGVGFETLSRESNVGPQQSLWIQSLKDSNCSPASVKQVVDQGAAMVDLRQACSCIQLKAVGYKFIDLQHACTCKELKAAGFNARQMKDAGYTASRLRACGFDACELKAAGFTAQELKDAGFSDGELKGAGYSDDDIARASGLPPGITAEDVRKAGCSVDGLRKLREAGVSAAAIRRISGCSASQLKAAGFSAQDLKNAGFSAADLLKAGFTPDELRKAGFSARDLMDAGLTPEQLAAAGFSPAQIATAEAELPAGMTPEDVKAAGCTEAALKRERLAGVSAELIRKYAGCSAQALKAAGFTDADLANAGFTPAQIAAFTPEKIKSGMDDAAIKAAGCDPDKLRQLFLAGVSAKRIHELNGCSAAQLKAAGYTAKDLADAGFTPQELLAAGFTPQQLLAAGLSPSGVIAAGRTDNCSVASLRAARELGVTAATIKQTLGCSAKQLKDAGYTAAELKAAGFTAAELKDAGFSAAELKNAGFSAKELAAAGFSAQALKDAGFSAADLKEAGFSDAELKNAGFILPEAQVAPLVTKAPPPVVPNKIVAIPSIPGSGPNQAAGAGTSNTKELQEILKKQQRQMADQRYKQQIQQRTAAMLQAGTQLTGEWKINSAQVFIAGNDKDDKDNTGGLLNTPSGIFPSGSQKGNNIGNQGSGENLGKPNIIEAGEVLFAVFDTSVNSDEPGPILATIVSGKFNGAKLIGSFNLPGNADKMVVTFNTMSIPGASKTISVNAYAIDPNTARTALSSKTDHHYLVRYGSLFASTFLEGFGNAFQSANTTVTIGGPTGGTQNTTISNGVGRSVLENAVIGLATLGKTWGQIAQQQFSRPTTVEIYSGTGVGILFTQDVQAL